MTFPRVSRRGRHFANVGDVVIYPDLVVARTDDDDDDDDNGDTDEKLTGPVLSTVLFAKQPTYTSGPDFAKNS